MSLEEILNCALLGVESNRQYGHYKAQIQSTSCNLNTFNKLTFKATSEETEKRCSDVSVTLSKL